MYSSAVHIKKTKRKKCIDVGRPSINTVLTGRRSQSGTPEPLVVWLREGTGDPGAPGYMPSSSPVIQKHA